MTADSALPPWLHAAHTTLAVLRARGAHAALLHGPAGIGKWALAMAFARDALCEAPDAHARACGACPSCRLGAAGNHPDLRVVVPDALAFRRPVPAEAPDEDGAARDRGDGEGNGAEAERGAAAKASREIKIEAVRNLAAFTGVTTHRGGLRVVVLGPAEALNAAAANALLKGLEEPPPQSLFLLVSDHLDWCLPTIVSRCTLVRVAVPPRQAALNWLLAQGIPDAGQRLTEAGGAPLAAVREDGDGLDVAVAETLRGLLRLGPRLHAAQIAAQVPRTIPVTPSIALFQRWTWDFLSVCLGGHLRYHPQEAASFAALARAWTPDAAVSWLDRLRDARATADHPLNARAVVEGLLLAYRNSMAEGRADA